MVATGQDGPPKRPQLSPSHSSFAASRPLNLRIAKLLTPTPDATLHALDTLAQHALDTPDARGGLRREVERRLATDARTFLAAFGDVNARLDELQGHLSAMHQSCDAVATRLSEANRGTRYLLEHAEGLRNERATTGLRLDIARVFLGRFTLQPDELALLTAKDRDVVGPELFWAMDKLGRIRADCQTLLAVDSALAPAPDDAKPVDDEGEAVRAGLSIMSATSSHLDAGYEKMARWASFQVRGASSSAAKSGETPALPHLEQATLETSVSDALRETIRRLKARPALLREVLDLLASSRSSVLLSLFLNALTRGGPAPSYLPRPIELHAHDPLRYVGDMLAWVHQAMAGEREFLEGLFGVKNDGRWVGSVRPSYTRPAESDQSLLHETDADDEGRIRSLLDRNLEGCGRPLKIRITQTIRSQEGSLVSYRLAQLIAFYRSTLEATIGSEAGVTKVLAELATVSHEAFLQMLETHGRSLLRFVQPPASDLSPPLLLRDTLSTLRELMAVYAEATSDGSEPATPFDDVLERSLGPALEMCSRMGEMRPSTWDRSIFAINCIAFVQAVLEPHSRFTATRLAELDDQVRRHVENLTADHYATLLRDSGLAPIVEAIDGRQDDSPLSHIPAASPQALQAAVRTFDTFLSTVDVLSSAKLALLSPVRLASAIHRAALGRLSAAYRRIHERVMDPIERYEFRATALRKAPGDVEVLLGVEGDAAASVPAK